MTTLIALLISLGLIGSPADYNNLTPQQQDTITQGIIIGEDIEM
ncbi:MAG: hypothetical protein R2828_19330 [Saprospiraceae bacterium]